jgi:hypothetical protein
MRQIAVLDLAARRCPFWSQCEKALVWPSQSLVELQEWPLQHVFERHMAQTNKAKLSAPDQKDCGSLPWRLQPASWLL